MILKRNPILSLGLLPVLLIGTGTASHAQGDAPNALEAMIPLVEFTDLELPPLASPQNPEEIAFSAQTVEYDAEGDTVIATGDVQMVREGAR